MQPLHRLFLSAGLQTRFGSPTVTQNGMMASRPATPDAFTRNAPRFGANAKVLPADIQALFDEVILNSKDEHHLLWLVDSALFDIPADQYAEGLRQIVQACPDVKTLTVANKHVTDEGIQLLAGLSYLETLSLDGTEQVTDAGLRELAGLKHLKSLTLFELPQVTPAGCDDLKTQLPGLEINVQFDCGIGGSFLD